MTSATNFPVGTVVRIESPSSVGASYETQRGDLLTVTVASTDESYEWAVAYGTQNDESRGTTEIAFYINQGGLEKVVTVLGVGARVKVLEARANGARVAADATGVVTEARGESFYVKMDEGHGGRLMYSEYGADWVFSARHLEVIAATTEPETLESFKIKFLTGAISRGEANGTTHSQQVTEALNLLAGYEFLEPSTDLLSFQKRVVALAMDAKGKHTWCGEPESYLTSIGLDHLLPVRKFVKVEVMVEVTAPAGSSNFHLEAAAADRLRPSLNSSTDYFNGYSVQ